MRCIVHIDLDCFYAQVEAVRLKIDCDNTPYVLVQWGNLIAVNYPARAFGVKRFHSLKEAQALCPQLLHSHVATYAVGETEYKYHTNVSKATHKVALQPYREASEKIFQVVGEFSHGIVLEKVGIDEMFLDITDAAQALANETPPLNLISDFDCTHTATPPMRDVEGADGLGLEGFQPSITDSQTLMFFAGAVIVSKIRAALYNQLQYRCSAGIAHNCMLAKVLSAANKPNKQTILWPPDTLKFLQDVKMEKLRGLGGKAGKMAALSCHGAETCGDFWRYSQDHFVQHLGREMGEHIFGKIRGVGTDTLTERSVTKSLLAQKVFAPPTNTIDGVKKWALVLAVEIVQRLSRHCRINNVAPQTFTVKFGCTGDLGTVGDQFTHAEPIPDPVSEERLVACAAKLAAYVFQKSPGIKIFSVSMAVHNFKSKGGESGGGGGGSAALKGGGRQLTLAQTFGRRASSASRPAAAAAAENNEISPRKRLRDDAEEDGGEDEIVILSSCPASSAGSDRDVEEVGAPPPLPPPPAHSNEQKSHVVVDCDELSD